MVSKAKAVKGSAQAINYILNDKGQAQELGRNLVSGENGEEILAEMREIQAEKTPDIKTQIRQAYEQSAKKGYTFEDFSKAMNSKGIEVKPTINSKGEMQGMRFLHKSSGTDLKASELGKAFGTRNLIDRGVNLTKMPLPANMAEIARKAVKAIAGGAERKRGYKKHFQKYIFCKVRGIYSYWDYTG